MDRFPAWGVMHAGHERDLFPPSWSALERRPWSGHLYFRMYSNAGLPLRALVVSIDAYLADLSRRAA